MIADLDPVSLAARLKQLPAKQRRTIERWLADDALRRSVTAKVTRAVRLHRTTQPTPAQGAVLAKLVLYKMDWIGRGQPLNSCIDNGWARRQGDSVVITTAGRAWLEALLVRPNKKTVISKAIRPRQRRGSLKTDADHVDIGQHAERGGGRRKQAQQPVKGDLLGDAGSS